jgi:hypothetical protein
VATAAKIRLTAAGVNDCAGFLHTLTTGFNQHALIVHISGKIRYHNAAPPLPHAAGLNF